MLRSSGIALTLVLAGACDGTTPAKSGPAADTDSASDLPSGPETTPLTGAALVRRWSLDVRGVVPTEAELDGADAAPDDVDAFLDSFLDDARVEDRLVILLGERWLTRADRFQIDGMSFGYDPEADIDFRRAVGEEPLRLVARILVEDRPWSEVVTTPTTMVNDALADIWPVDYPEGKTGWQEVNWEDERPAMGVLATNGLWWRYVTSPGNLNRHRAAAIARLLMCEDYLERPVAIGELDPTIDGSVESLIRTNDGCVTCHSTLDPIAVNFFGFWWYNTESEVELIGYHGEREALGSYYLGTQGAWFGTPVAGPSELPAAIVADDRLGRCAVRTFAQLFWRRKADVDDFAALVALEGAVRPEEFRGRVLLRTILAADEYRTGALTESADAVAETRHRTRRLMTDAMFASTIADLTGFVWTSAGLLMFDNDEEGYRVLAGGVDGVTVTAPMEEPAVTRAVAFERLAEAAAAYTAAESFAGRSGMLSDEAVNSRPDDDAWQDTVRALHRRLHNLAVDDAEIAEDAALWQAVADEEGAQAAWAALLAVYFRDPAYQVY